MNPIERKWTERISPNAKRSNACLSHPCTSDVTAPLRDSFLDTQTRWVLFPPDTDIVEWRFPEAKIPLPLRIRCEPRKTIGHQIFVDYELLDPVKQNYRCDIFTIRDSHGFILGFNESAIRYEVTGHIENGRTFYSEEGADLEALKKSAINKLEVFTDIIHEYGQLNVVTRRDGLRR